MDFVVGGEYENFTISKLEEIKFEKVRNLIYYVNDGNYQEDICIIKNMNIRKLFIIINVKVSQQNLFNIQEDIIKSLPLHKLNLKSLFIQNQIYESIIKETIEKEKIKKSFLNWICENREIIFKILILFGLFLVIIIVTKNTFDINNTNNQINLDKIDNENNNLILRKTFEEFYNNQININTEFNDNLIIIMLQIGELQNNVESIQKLLSEMYEDQSIINKNISDTLEEIIGDQSIINQNISDTLEEIIGDQSEINQNNSEMFNIIITEQNILYLNISNSLNEMIDKQTNINQNVSDQIEDMIISQSIINQIIFDELEYLSNITNKN